MGHAPNGLLNEKSRGSISAIVKPEIGQANLEENVKRSLASRMSAKRMPSLRLSPVSMLSANRELRPSRMITRSTTTSMSCFLFFSI